MFDPKRGSKRFEINLKMSLKKHPCDQIGNCPEDMGSCRPYGECPFDNL